MPCSIPTGFLDTPRGETYTPKAVHPHRNEAEFGHNMTLKDKLQEDLKDAMRSGDVERRSVIRYLRSEVHNAEIAKQADLDEEAVIGVLTRQAKQRRDSIDAYKQVNRTDLVEKEEGELAIILEYLPEQMSDDEITELATAAIAETGATGPKDMGKVMGKIMPETRGKADGSKVSAIVNGLLNELAG